MRQSDLGTFSFGDLERKRQRDLLKKSLRVIPGGKQSSLAKLWDAKALKDDKFLRLHYLEKPARPSEAIQHRFWENEPSSPWN